MLQLTIEEKFQNYEGDSDYSDPSDYEDSIQDEALVGDQLSQKPAEIVDVDQKSIIIDGLPEVDAKKMEKLEKVLKGKIGCATNFHIAFDEESGKSKGYAFVHYEEVAHAKKAVKELNGFKLDRRHTFHVNFISDIEKYENMDMEKIKTEPKPYKEQSNLQYYLFEKNCIDQLCVTARDGKTVIYENTPNEPTLIMERNRWTEKYTRWSVRGNYLATVHTKGIALWGGPEFKQVQRFLHNNVCLMDFSPCERYLVTLSMAVQGRPETPAIVKFFDIFSGIEKRKFTIENGQTVWPLFKWSHDGKYFARKTPNSIQIYETPSFGLLDKKSLQTDHKEDVISDFQWSPTSNLLAYSVAQRDQVPARVTIIQIPNRKEIRVKNIGVNAENVRLSWHPDGKYFSITRRNKTKKAENSIIDIFHIEEKGVPVDNLELKETLQGFSWEPKGNKFCILTGMEGYTQATFYEIKKGKVELIGQLERKSASHIFWSPRGQFVVLATIDQQHRKSGLLQFVDTSDMSVMHQGEHHGASYVDWDPTGRYVVSTATHWLVMDDSKSIIWSFQGRQLRKIEIEGLSQTMWRPRPPTLLSADNIKEIKRNLKTYSKDFEKEDRLMKSRVSKEILDKRRQMMFDFEEFKKECAAKYEQERCQRRMKRNDVNTDSLESMEDEWEEVIIDVLISTNEEVITE